MKDRKTKNRNIVTIETRDGIVCLNGYASASAHDYLNLILEACARRKIDARDAIINTDSYPQLNRTADVEFAIGWLHGLAEAHGLDAEDVFDAMAMPAVAEDVADLKKSWGIGTKRRPRQKVTRRAAA